MRFLRILIFDPMQNIAEAFYWSALDFLHIDIYKW